MRAQGKPRVLVLSPEPLFRSFFDDAHVRRLDRSFRWSRAVRVPASASDAEALVTTWDTPFLTEQAIRRFPRVRMIAHCGGEVKARFARTLFDRITITNAPGPMAPYVAELAVALLLYGARNVDAHRAAVRRPDSRVHARVHRDGLRDETIAGRNIGLLGLGRIGREIALRLRPFGVNLLVHDPYVKPDAVRELGGTPVSWSALLDRSQHLVLAAALTDRTRGMLDRAALARLRDGALIVNVARGAMIDLDALTREVRSGRLRCALDVTDPEPLPPRHPLRKMRGAILTPHVAAGMREVRLAMADIVVDELERFFGGRGPNNRVTAAMLDRMT